MGPLGFNTLILFGASCWACVIFGPEPLMNGLPSAEGCFGRNGTYVLVSGTSRVSACALSIGHDNICVGGLFSVEARLGNQLQFWPIFFCLGFFLCFLLAICLSS